MAIFHSHTQVISRGKGKSAVAAAAYRAGKSIKNNYDGVTHNYTHKGGIVHTEILLPNHAPKEYFDRAVLWNAVEKIEKAANSQLARELNIALPAELSIEQNLALIRRYVQDTFVNAGMCADLCIHDKSDGNPHAHIMLTMRPINEDGTWGSKQKKEYLLDYNGNKVYDPKKRQYKCRSIPSTDWNNQANADIWRAAWEDAANAELKRLGFASHIDRRTYAEQGIEQIPTIHIGPAATQMEKRGIRTERGNMNRAIEITNKEMRQLRARIVKLEKGVTEKEATNINPPNLYDVVMDILNRPSSSKISRLKDAAHMLNFLDKNKMYSLSDLEAKVASMHDKVEQLREDMKPVVRRINTLKEHLRHSENFKKYRKIKQQYDELYSLYKIAQNAKGFGAKRKEQKALNTFNAYVEEHRPEITMYDSSEKYFRDVLQKRYDPKKLPPITKWRGELVAKEAEREAMYQEYAILKNETQQVEQIRQSVTEIIQDENHKTQPRRMPGMEL